VPTPFTHLATVPEILAAPALPAAARSALQECLPAFLLGNIAPDVQTISGQRREATHFFPVPLDAGPPATARLLARHPRLAAPGRLPPEQAGFVAGYLAHLVLDQRWVAEVFEPVFGPRQQWDDFRERLYLHNVLRAHWDAADLARLPPGLPDELRAAAPEKPASETATCARVLSTDSFIGRAASVCGRGRLRLSQAAPRPMRALFPRAASEWRAARLVELRARGSPG
jgi:hypothetical protein